MKTYKIIEDHGLFGVKYTRFNGNLNECQKWLKSNCWYDKSTDSYYSNDPKDVNGYNEVFTYHIEVDDE